MSEKYLELLVNEFERGITDAVGCAVSTTKRFKRCNTRGLYKAKLIVEGIDSLSVGLVADFTYFASINAPAIIDVRLGLSDVSCTTNDLQILSCITKSIAKTTCYRIDTEFCIMTGKQFAFCLKEN